MEPQSVPTGCVVVGVDAAQLTDRALDWAADQAALEQRHLLLVHGIGSPLSVGTPDSGLGGPDPMQVFVDLQAAGRALLARATTRVVTRHPELVVHQAVRAIDPRQALLEASADAAMVVVGSRGRGHVLSLVLGSVSEEVAGRASCPVVVIRPRHDHEPRNGVLVGTDGTAESEPVLQFASRLARVRELPLTVLQDPGDAASAAQSLIARAGSMDLVVVGHHPRGTLGRFTHASVAVAVLEHASVAIAVVPVVAESLASAP